MKTNSPTGLRSPRRYNKSSDLGREDAAAAQLADWIDRLLHGRCNLLLPCAELTEMTRPLPAHAAAALSLAVVVPALNEAAHIQTTLHALAPLRERGAQVVVVDGGSSDGTPALAVSGADQVIPAARGRARQMNAGAAATQSQWLWFVHADTVVPPQAVAAWPALAADAQIEWGHFQVQLLGRSRWLPMVAACMNARSRASGIATGDQGIFVRRTWFDRVGGFPDQPLMEDIEISARLRRSAGRPTVQSARLQTSGRRWDERGAWATIALMWRLRLLYSLGVSPEQLARAYR